MEKKSSFFHEIQEIAHNLPYRDFITVGLLNNLSDPDGKLDDADLRSRTDLKVGRLQIFNN